MSIKTVTIPLNESGSFANQSLTLGTPFVVLQSANTSSILTSAIINSITAVVSGSKYDMDILFFNKPLSVSSSFVNASPVTMSGVDAQNCIAKVRIENNGSASDDYLNIVGQTYIATLFNLNIPIHGNIIYGVAVFQDVTSSALNNNTTLNVNYTFVEQDI